MIIDITRMLLKKNESEIDRDAILSVMVYPDAMSIIEDAGLRPSKFILYQPSKEKFMTLPITYRELDDSFCCIYFDSRTSETIYRAECRVTIEPASVSTYATLYKLDNYQNGNRNWLYFTGADWCEGPGTDFFELNEFSYLPIIKHVGDV